MTAETKRRPDLADAIKRGLPTRWVLRSDVNGDQWAVLIECAPGPAPESGGFIIQMLREDGSPAHKIHWPNFAREGGLDFHVEGEGLIRCPTTYVHELEAGLATLADIEEEGFRWDGTIYEPDRDKLILGIVEWKPWKEGETDGR